MQMFTTTCDFELLKIVIILIAAPSLNFIPIDQLNLLP
jgi:hypothetical protein